MKKAKKITMMIGTATIILSTTILAQTGTVNAPSGLVLRGEPERGGSIITTVEDDTKVEIIEKSGDWYKVKYNGDEGYLFAEYVEVENLENPDTDLKPDNETTSTNTETTTENTNSNTQVETPEVTVGTNTQIKNEAKIYVMPLISSTPVGTIAAGTTITVEKTITNWSYIKDGTQEGWIRTYLITGEVKPTEQEAPETPEKPEDTNKPETPSASNTQETPIAKKGVISVDFANVRKEASQTSDVVTTLARGADIVISAETEEWYKITYTGTDGTVYEGYIAKRLIEAE